MKATVTVGRIYGIPIGVHYTWLAAFGFITWSLAEGFFPRFFPGWETSTYWWLAWVSAASLFLSVLIHELAHSAVALKRGIVVQSITLFIFGGVSNLRADSGRALDEFLIAVVGPLTSIALGATAWLTVQVLSDDVGALRALVSYLALTNVILGAFNLLPGFPLDGGRVLRSLVWGVTGNFARATALAATAGQMLSFAFMGFGALQLLEGRILSGLWIVFIGWFLNTTADSSRREEQVNDLLREVPVSALMGPAMTSVRSDLSVAELVTDMLLRGGRRVAIVFEEGRLAGIVTITDVWRAPEGRWEEVTVSQIMTHAPLLSVSPTEKTSVALGLMVGRDVNQVVVSEAGQLVGLLSRSHVVNYLDFPRATGDRREVDS